MKFIRFGKHTLVFGVKWATLLGSHTPAKEIKDIAKETKSNFYVSMARDGGIPIIGLAKTLKGSGLKYSAAALLPNLVTNLRHAIFAFKFDDGLVGAICFLDGFPMIGCDIVGTPQTVGAKVDSFINSLKEESSELKFYGDLAAIGNYEHKVIPFIFDADILKDSISETAVFKRAYLPTSFLLSTFAAIILVLVFYYAYDWYQQNLIRQRAVPTIDPNTAYEANVKLMLAEAGYPANQALNALIPNVSTLPLYLGGWKLQSANCQVDSCSMEWASDLSLPSTFAGFNQALPPDWTAIYQSNFQSINTSMVIKSEIKKGINLSDLIPSNQFLMQMGSEVQRLKSVGIQFDVRAPALFAVPALPPKQPPITIDKLTNPVKEGTWSMIGPMSSMEYMLASASNIVLSSFALKNQGTNIIIQMEGKYYVSK